MTYVCYYHITGDRVEHVVTDLTLPQFVRQEPYARVLSWIPLDDSEEAVELRHALDMEVRAR